MARDSQAALVALNRFGFGARGGASGDFVNAASDPRGFVKAELNRPNGVLLEMPGLLSTPALAQAVFAYQVEIKQAREAAAKSGAPLRPMPSRRDAAAATRRIEAQSLASTWRWTRRRPSPRTTPAATTAMTPTEAMQPSAPKPPPQPLNIIQKTFRAEALARLQRAVDGRLRFHRAAGGVLVQSFLHFRRQGRAGADVGRLVRARGDPAPCARPLRRHAEGGRAASGDAVLSRQPAIARSGFPRRAKPQARAERKSRARNHGAAYARRRRRLHPGRRDLAGAHHHRLDLCRTRRENSATPGSFVFNANAHQPGAAAAARQESIRTTAWRRARRRSPISRAIPATAKFIATKFARHFVADDPPPALVARLQDVFTKSDGDLKALAMALVDSDEAWQAPLTKVRSPYEFLVATGRLLARMPEDPGRYLGGLNRAGPAVVVAGRAERISRHQCGLGRARRHEAAARYLGAGRLARSATASIRAICSNSSRPMRRRRRRGAPSSARNRGSRRWRCC